MIIQVNVGLDRPVVDSEFQTITNPHNYIHVNVPTMQNMQYKWVPVKTSLKQVSRAKQNYRY